MECRNCGKEIKNGVRFCSACGMPVSRPIVSNYDYDSSRDIFSDSSMIPASADLSGGFVSAEDLQTEVCSPGYVTAEFRIPESYIPPEDEKTKNGRGSENILTAFRNMSFKRKIIDAAAVFTGVVIIAAALFFTVRYIGESSKADASSDTSSYYEMDTGIFSADEAKQIAFASENPSVLDMTEGGLKCEGKRYAVSGKVTGKEILETLTVVKLSCCTGGSEITFTVNFESSRADEAKKLKNGQETCITGVLDLQNADGRCTAFLNYAECDI